jgi:AcrR family transcriptional regulator
VTDEKRTYRKRRRAELEEQTRRRITESTVALHGSVGPSRTSISAVAEHAGVRRSTVYRHFPDEPSLFAACSAHWNARNPSPDIGAWAAIDDPDERLQAGIAEMYGYYRSTEQMMANLHRDEVTMPVVKRLFGGFHDYQGAAADALMLGRRCRGSSRRRVAAAIGHALSFPTWRSLANEQGLSDRQAAELMCRLVTVAAEAAVSAPVRDRAPGSSPPQRRATR